MKIIDRIKKGQEEGRPLFSFEYFSPKTAQVYNINNNERTYTSNDIYVS